MYLAALDQGTTSSRTILFGTDGTPAASHSVEFRQLYPQPGYVEHDPEDIFRSQLESFRYALEKAKIAPKDIYAAAIANQRETCIVWDKNTGMPAHNAVVWQCRRSAGICAGLIKDGMESFIRERTGLATDAYFSAAKLTWLFNNIPGLRERAQKGDLLFGTVDTYLLWRLTLGKCHKTDATNASRTMLFNIHTHSWDDELLKLFGIPRCMLPEVCETACEFGHIDASFFGREIPVLAMAGDQQAALFGQLCHEPGMLKNTYGTGCFLLMNTGDTPVESRNRLITTIAWRLCGKTEYALEGSVFSAGSVVQWLRDELRIIDCAAQSHDLAVSVDSTGGVYLVPAFTGLGAPHWDMFARGALLGITRGTNRAHIARAALESIAFQSMELALAMSSDSGSDISALRADGGASANDFLMQFQADLLGIPVRRSCITETTALGAAMLAGLKGGVWTRADLKGLYALEREFMPQMARDEAATRLKCWQRAVARTLCWEENV